MPVHSWKRFVFLAILNAVLMVGVISLFVAIKKRHPVPVAEPAKKSAGPAFIPYQPGNPVCKDCNVILVSLDTLSANHLPCYGYDRETAPSLCKFGENNIFYEHMYANAYYTLPSHVSIFTGLYPYTHKVNTPYRDSLDRSIPFLPEILQQNGYYTHFGMIKTDQHLPLDKVYNRGIDDITAPDESKTLWTGDLELFREKVKSGKKTFMFLHTYAVHAPYWAPGETIFTKKHFDNIPLTPKQFATCSPQFITYAKQALREEIAKNTWQDTTSKYQKLYDGIANDATADKTCTNPENEDLLYTFRYNFYYSKENINTPEQVQFLKDIYDQKIVEMDKKLAALFSLMEDPEIKKNTIIVITADHGEEFMEHNEITHLTLYDSNVRIPLFVYVPGLKKRTVSSVTESVDLAPTILDLVGIKGSYQFQGASLAKELLGENTGKGYAVAEHGDLKIQTIRTDTYKLFTKGQSDGTVPYELYNISSDPEELRNIIFSNPSTTETLNKRLNTVLGIE